MESGVSDATQSYRQDFIELALECEVLQFGEFELKSGRVSPYFFNAGKISSGAALARLGRCYAAALSKAKLSPDMLFGPAYKGIPLVSVLSSSLFVDHEKNVPFVYNRKEKKDHGEGGQIVGPSLSGKVVIVDDVITAGTAIKEASKMITQASAEISGILIALDRQEKGGGDLSAVEEVSKELGVPVISIVNLDQILTFVKNSSSELEAFVEKIEAYREKYGA